MKEGREERQEKLPIDAKLLSEAVMELNISRRSVSIYPREHPLTRGAIERAFQLLQRLFEIRGSITLGIVKDTLVIDEYILERKNPVFREFAHNLSSRGIVAITFTSGVSMEELLLLHELITMQDSLPAQDMIELAGQRGLTHISLSPLDMSRLRFVEDRMREGGSETDLYEDYVYALLEGKLADGDAEEVVLNVPPGNIATFLNNRLDEETSGETYERVITTYLKGKGEQKSRGELFARFVSLIEDLTPELKQQFLRRAVSTGVMDSGEIDRLLEKLTLDDLERMMNFFKGHPTLIPESLRNLIDKLGAAKKEGGFFDTVSSQRTVVDDIEIDGTFKRFFAEDQFQNFVSDEYRTELERMLEHSGGRRSAADDELTRVCSDEVIEKEVAEVMLELLDADTLSREVCLIILTKLSGLVDDFLETGRFQEICDIHNSLYSHAITGRFKEETSGMVDYFFRSENFIAKLMDAFKTWGRHNREGVFRLSNVLKHYVMSPLFDALSEETEAAVRKFLLEILVRLRVGVVPEAARRLGDDRWYVVRNMLYLIRECEGSKYVSFVRPFAKHGDRRVCMEALKSLLAFNSPDAVAYLKFYLRSNNQGLRDQAIALAGSYRTKEVIPYLIDLLERKDLLGREMYNKIPVIRALGQIGSPAALEPLRKLYCSKTLIYRGLIEEIREEIFRSLSSYPPHALKGLLELGLRSKNREIRTISERLLRGHGKEDGKNN